jgi:hypothetical protein
MKEPRNKYIILVRQHEWKRSLGDLGRGASILRRDLGKVGLEVFIGLTWLRVQVVAGCCEHGNELRVP